MKCSVQNFLDFLLVNRHPCWLSPIHYSVKNFKFSLNVVDLI